MVNRYGNTTQIQACLDRWRDGDTSARGELIRQSSRRLRQLAGKMLKGYPTVGRWEETDDVLQSAAIRLDRALAEVRPSSVADFIGLAALQLRRQLIDLARHYAGREGCGGVGAPAGHSSESGQSRYDPPDATSGPATLAQWTDFHRLVEKLPAEEHEVFDLHFYGGLTLVESAVNWECRSAP